MIDRFMDKIEWPGRRVKPATDTDRPGEEGLNRDPESGPSGVRALIPPEHQNRIREELDEAAQALQEMEQAAYEVIDEHLDREVSDLPQTRESLRYLAGTHPDYGTRFPEVPEEDQLPDDRITAAAFRRAYDTMEHGDVVGLGYDIEASIYEEPGTLKPVGQINNPALAAGERTVPRKEAEPTESIIEKNETKRQMSFWKKAMYAIFAMGLKVLGTTVRSIAEQVEDALNIRVMRVTVPVGKYISYPIHWLADQILELSEDLLARAVGYRPEERKVDPKDIRTTDRDEPERNRPTRRKVRDMSTQPLVNETHNPLGEDFPAADASDHILMGASRVLQTTMNEARVVSTPKLAQAIDTFERSRVLQRDLYGHNQMATAWGVDPPSGGSADNLPDVQPEPEAEQQSTRGRFASC